MTDICYLSAPQVVMVHDSEMESKQILRTSIISSLLVITVVAIILTMMNFMIVFNFLL